MKINKGKQTMALSSDLMGIGVQPLLAETIASAGIGPVAVTSTTTYDIQANQRLIEFTGASVAPVLPIVGTDNGAKIGDVFYILNNTGGAITVTAPSTYNIIGAGASEAGGTGVSLSNETLYIFIAISTTVWAYK